MLAPFAEGEAFLRDAKGEVFRLTWESRERAAPAKSAARLLPAGEYTLVGYRAVRQDRQGVAWMISVIANGGPRVSVSSGQPAKLPISDTIYASAQLRPKGQVGMMLAGEGRSGLSLYKNWRRVPMNFRIVDANGVVRASGRITYG